MSAYGRATTLGVIFIALLLPAKAHSGPQETEQLAHWLALRAETKLRRLTAKREVGTSLEDFLEEERDENVARELRLLYRRNGGRTLFMSRGELSPSGEEAARLVVEVTRHGIRPDGYRCAEVRQLVEKTKTLRAALRRPPAIWTPPKGWTVPDSPPFEPEIEERLDDIARTSQLYVTALQRLDVRLAAGLLRFIQDTADDSPGRGVPSTLVLRLARSEPHPRSEVGSVPGAPLMGLLPDHPQYALLVAALERYRFVWATSSLQKLPPEAPVLPGTRSGVVGLARERLALMGFLDEPGQAVFDDTMRRALENYQRSRGRRVTGEMDEGTRRDLNRDPEWWLRRIMLALHRHRTSPTREVLGRTYIRTNIPEYVTELWVEGERELRMPSLVGSPETPTPELSSTLTEFRINPRWNVPPGVEQREIEPRLLDDSGFKEEYRFRRAGRGARVRYYQEPGPWNFLGRAIFPIYNRDYIALHGSRRDHLFSSEKRAHSNGCVNLKDEVAFARAILEADRHPARARLDGWLESWRTRTVRLRRPIPVYLEYQTVVVDDEGVINFLPDIYRLDRPLLTEIDEPRHVWPKIAPHRPKHR